jgi:hypothetical protein
VFTVKMKLRVPNGMEASEIADDPRCVRIMNASLHDKLSFG